MTNDVYYNEIDPHCCQWLQNLMDARVISKGVIDNRDIRDVVPKELVGFRRVHFFAGVGVWDYALNKAGFEGRCWTGSCPCQPFSTAGKRGGFADERHLWPHWHWLIHQCRPETIFGEQIASKDGLAWLDLVCADLEGTGYAGWVGDLCAAGFGAPQIRQRLYFVANAGCERCDGQSIRLQPRKSRQARFEITGSGENGDMAHAEGERLLGWPDDGDEGRRQRASGQGCEAGRLVTPCERFSVCAYPDECEDPNRCCDRARDEARTADEWDWPESSELEHASRDGWEQWRPEPGERGVVGGRGEVLRPGPTNGFWRDADWIRCTDGKWRPVEPESFPLVDGSAFRLGSGGPFEGKSRAKMLKGYGNAIVAEQAAEFIRAADSAIRLSAELFS